MADIATPSAAAMSTIDAGADHPEKDQKASGRPTKPDEDTYKKNLANAEKAHATAQEKIVRVHLFVLSVNVIMDLLCSAVTSSSTSMSKHAGLSLGSLWD